MPKETALKFVLFVLLSLTLANMIVSCAATEFGQQHRNTVFSARVTTREEFRSINNAKNAQTNKAELRETYSGDCGDSAHWELNTETGLLSITGSGMMYNFSESYPPWYNYKDHVKSLTIENSITSIGDLAFRDCSFLTSITIPSFVTYIGFGAFSGCSSLTLVEIPSSVTFIGSGAFSGCSSLTSITVDDENENYKSQDEVLFDKGMTILLRYPAGNSRTSYEIPSSVTSIESEAFYDCISLKTLSMPSFLTSIGYAAFYSCISLKSVTIPSSVTSIESSAFFNCSSLTSVTLNNNYAVSRFRKVFDSSQIENITLGQSVTSISESAFLTCISLKFVSIASSVTSIERDAFHDCNSLTSITIPSSVTSIRDSAFNNCYSLSDVEYLGINDPGKTSSEVFKDCQKLSAVIVPKDYKDKHFCGMPVSGNKSGSESGSGSGSSKSSTGSSSKASTGSSSKASRWVLAAVVAVVLGATLI